MNLNPKYILTRDFRYITTRVSNIVDLRNRLRDNFGIAWGHMRWTAWHEETLRHTYDLNGDSVVFDLGGYEGAWSEKIYSKYSPNIYIFEPIEAFYKKIADIFKDRPKVKVFKCGLSGETKTVKMSLNDVRSSEFSGAGMPGEDAQLVKAGDFFKENGIKRINLMKINIEGGEYELLEHLLEIGFAKHIDNIQVQFHRFVPHARRRRRAIRRALSKTHSPTYMFSFVWENWKRRDSIA